MPAISGRKICWRFRVEKKKNAGNVGSEQNVGKFRPEKKKMSVFSGGDKIAGKLTGL